MKKIKDMTKQEKQVLSQRVQLYGGLLLIFVTLALFLRVYNTRQISTEGILPTPRKSVENLAVTFVSQTDPAWADAVLGDTGYSMKEEGSLFCALSMVLQSNGIQEDPGTINARFMEQDMYVDGKAADLTRLAELYPEIRFRAPRDFNGETITRELRAGRACMVRTKKGNHAHWLCVIGADEDDFFVYDPSGTGLVTKLSDHGNVFALGLIQPQS